MSDCANSDVERYFLSYCRADAKFGLRLAQDLRDQGVPIFVDQWDIRPSEHWDRAIERAVGCCRGLIVIISPRSIASDNVMDEVSFAIDNAKSVLPVMIEKCVLPLRITRMHVVDATESYDKALQQCLAELVRPDRLSGGSAQPQAAQAVAQLDPEAVAAAKQQLLPILGPIAKYVVERESSRAKSLAELHRLLAQHIDNEADRERFLAVLRQDRPPTAAKPKSVEAAVQASSIPSTELESISKALTHYLGPIAQVVAKRESRNSSSAADLSRRLAGLIPNEQDRSAFLRRVEGHVVS